MTKKKGLRAKAKKSSSTVLYSDDYRRVAADCAERGITESEQLREITSAYYSNERLKTIGRDYIESPIKNIHREAIAAEVAPLKDKVTNLVMDVRYLRQLTEDFMATLSLAGHGAENLSKGGGEGQAIDPTPDRATAETVLSPVAPPLAAPPPVASPPPPQASPERALAKDQVESRQLTAMLAMEVIRTAVYEAARNELGPMRQFVIEWSPESGFKIRDARKVVGDVSDERKEISAADVWERTGSRAEVGQEVNLPIPLDELVRIANRSMTQFQDVED